MKTTFEIENLKCGGCVKTATEGVAALDEISNVIVSLENNSITFKSTDEGSINKVEEKLKEIGYPKKEEVSLLDKAKAYLNK
jgi:copper chaperone|tara:strand:+ start:653 stop:898 length:246 start_codon:yes stop_codon:yes gene_type:complete